MGVRGASDFLCVRACGFFFSGGRRILHIKKVKKESLGHSFFIHPQPPGENGKKSKKLNGKKLKIKKTQNAPFVDWFSMILDFEQYFLWLIRRAGDKLSPIFGWFLKLWSWFWYKIPAKWNTEIMTQKLYWKVQKQFYSAADRIMHVCPRSTVILADMDGSIDGRFDCLFGLWPAAGRGSGAEPLASYLFLYQIIMHHESALFYSCAAAVVTCHTSQVSYPRIYY